ncbi:ATP-binding protein [Desulfatiferula olefinivorans]
MKQLPIGIANFHEIRTKDCYYVDKTPFIKRLADEGKYYFLSRPRRFGKSLFIDTLKEAFSGNKELFKGLFLENNWDWSDKNPVIHISFGAGIIEDRGNLDKRFDNFLKLHAEDHGLELRSDTLADRFSELIRLLYRQYNKKVVVLVDEYDKPILDNITDRQKAIEIRKGLKNLYSVIKDSDVYIKFCLLTGVSKFAKVSLFSGLNNLEDITLQSDYATLCGYTQHELETVFHDQLIGVDLEKLKRWYNGYNFLGDPVYNPFDILLYFREKKYKNYWFETATPGFLINLLVDKHYYIPKFNQIEVGEEVLGSFDIEQIYPETLMFQTGYLTIREESRLGEMLRYHLAFPNNEVESSFTNALLNYFVTDIVSKNDNQARLYNLLQTNDLDGLKDVFYSFYASIPNDWYRKNTIANYEGYYASIFYCYFSALGLDVITEDTTNKGRIDLTLTFENRIYIFEFKVVELTDNQNKAIEQIRTKKYHEKYVNNFDEIYLIGVEFSRNTRNIERFDWEKYVHHGDTENTEKSSKN